jgi:hypothetical protein
MYIRKNEKLLRTTNGIKEITKGIGIVSEEKAQHLLSLDQVSPYMTINRNKTKSSIQRKSRSTKLSLTEHDPVMKVEK